MKVQVHRGKKAVPSCNQQLTTYKTFMVSCYTLLLEDHKGIRFKSYHPLLYHQHPLRMVHSKRVIKMPFILNPCAMDSEDITAPSMRVFLHAQSASVALQAFTK